MVKVARVAGYTVWLHEEEYYVRAEEVAQHLSFDPSARALLAVVLGEHEEPDDE